MTKIVNIERPFDLHDVTLGVTCIHEELHSDHTVAYYTIDATFCHNGEKTTNPVLRIVEDLRAPRMLVKWEHSASVYEVIPAYDELGALESITVQHLYYAKIGDTRALVSFKHEYETDRILDPI